VSLRRRLMGAIFLQSIVLVSTVGVAVYWISSSSLRNSLDLSLVQLARTELASATDIGSVHIHDASPLTMSLSGLPGVEKFAWIESADGKVVAHTSNLAEFRPPQHVVDLSLQAARKGAFVETVDLPQGEVRCVFYPFTDQKGVHFLGVVGTPTTVYAETIGMIGWVVLLVVVCAALVALVWGTAVARRIAVPIEQLAVEVSALSPDDGVYESGVEPVYTEISDLVHSVEGMTGEMQSLLQERSKTIAAQRQFIADVSHELRTPISNISGTCEVLLRRPREEAEYIDAISVVQSETNRLNRLINDLLMLARHDVGKFQFVRTDYDLVEVLTRASQMARKFAPEHVTVTVATPDECVLLGDPERVRQAVDNLLRNAIVHASSSVRVTLIERGAEVAIRIWNDGSSLSDEDVDKIFGRFVRLDRSRSRDTGGSGLGLPIVRAIAEGQGGTVNVAGVPSGVQFELVLPR
jgi:signal transduction histidine kinase